VIRRRAWKRQSERHVHRVSERRDFDGGHSYIVIRRDHRVEFAAHGANKDRIGGERTGDSGFTSSRRQQLLVFVSEPASVAGVRVERAQRYPRRSDAEPLLQAIARDASGIDDGLRRELPDCLAQWKVSRRQDHPQLVGRQHHRDSRASQLRQHFGVAGEIVAASEERRFIDRSSNDPVNIAGRCQLHGALDGESTQFPRRRCALPGRPVSDRFRDIDTRSVRTDHHNVTALANPWVSERFGNDLRSNPAGIPDGHGKACFHLCYILSDT
jgi:hypothetical protein